MIAVDSNIIVRIFADDDAEQVKRARALFLKGPVFVSNTVILETEWVLRSVYKFRAGRIAGAFKAFFGVESVSCENPALLANALSAYEDGMEFADALHLAAATKCESFASFDAALKKLASKNRTFVPVIAP